MPLAINACKIGISVKVEKYIKAPKIEATKLPVIEFDVTLHVSSENLNSDILLKPKFPGIDPIVIHARVFDVDAIITAGIRDAGNVQGGRYTQ